MPDPTPLTVSLTILAITSLAGVFVWTVAATTLQRLRRNPPTVRAGLRLPAPNGGWPKVTIVIPAHNEERVIDRCARSLKSLDYPDYEVVFVLDRCTDGTLELLEPHATDARIRIIENGHCPDDWAGKCHAASLGAKAASGDILVFTDADVAFEPDLLRATVALAHHEERQLVSLLSTLTTEHRFERIVQPVATMQLLQQYPISRVNRRRRPRPFANGQFLQFDRDTYERIGGHERVREALLEDLEFARTVNHAGASGAVYLADGMLQVSMYGSWADFRKGWKRIFIEATRRSPRHLRKFALRLGLIGVGIPAVQIATIVLAVIVAFGGLPIFAAVAATPTIVGLVLQRWSLRASYRLGGTDPRASIWWPLGAWHVSRILSEAAADLDAGRPIRWGGREYVLEPAK